MDYRSRIVRQSSNRRLVTHWVLRTALDVDTPRVYHFSMTKKLIRHGNSAALILDRALLDLLKVQMDTPLEVTTDGRNIIISPQLHERAEATLLDSLEKINKKHGSVLSRLGK